MNRSTSRSGVVALAAASALVGLLELTTSARAIAPSDQTVSDVAFGAGTSLWSVVEVQGSDGSIGTGTVIGKHQSGNNDYLTVLTADHVICATGNLGGAPVNGDVGFGSPQPLNLNPYVVTARGGSTGNEDLAMLSVTVAAGAYAGVNPVTVVSPTIPNPYSGQAFTEYGYGDTGTSFTVAGINGYTEIANSTGTKRFQNNSSYAITIPTTNLSGNYAYQAVLWNTVAPANNAGEGVSFPGDSGGPYMSSDSQNIVTVSTQSGPVTISGLTNDEFAVHTFGFSTIPGTKVNNETAGGDFLTPADIAWITNNLNSSTPVPEPASLAMLALAGTSLLLIRRTRGIGKRS